MEQTAMQSFVDSSKAIDRTLKSYEAKSLSVNAEDGIFSLYSGSERLGVLSARAEKNIAKVAQTGYRLFVELTETLRNDVLRHQLSDKGPIGIIRNPTREDEIISVFETKVPYISYATLFSEIDPGSVTFVRGNPITDDKIQFLTSQRTITPRDQKPIQVGVMASVSSTDMVQGDFSYGTYRLICSNGLMTPIESRKLSSQDLVLVRTVYAELVKRVDENARVVESFVDQCISRELSEKDFENFLPKGVLPGSVEKLVKSTVENKAERTIQFEKAGIDSLSNLWDWVNLMTHISKTMTSDFSRTQTELKVFNWAQSVLRYSLN